MRTLRIAILGLASLLSVGCSVPHRVPPSAPAGSATTAVPPAGAEGRAGVRRLQVVPAESEVLVRVYRAGPFATLGHNHVILWHPVGWVEQAADLPGSRFELDIDLAQAEIDDARRRAAEGADFPGEIPPSAREGTARNMLGDALLDAARHPRLNIRSVSISGQGAPSARVAVQVAGRESLLEVPFRLEGDARLIASGEFSLTQSQLGLKPFSVMLGALQVQDEMRVRFRLVARAVNP